MKFTDSEMIRMTIKASKSKQELYIIIAKRVISKKLVDEFLKNNPKEKKKMLSDFEKKKEKDEAYKIIIDSTIVRVPEMIKTLRKLSKKAKFILLNVTIDELKRRPEKEKAFKFLEFAATEKKLFYYEKAEGETEEKAVENYCRNNNNVAVLTSNCQSALLWRTEGIEVIFKREAK